MHHGIWKTLTRNIQNLLHGATEREMAQFLANAEEEGDVHRIAIIKKVIREETAARKEFLGK